MEVYQCLHNLITKVEKQSQIIIRAQITSRYSDYY